LQRLKYSKLANRYSTKYDSRVLPFSSGPNVKIRIGSAIQEYRLPKTLLCTQVPDFAGMFREEQSKEGIELSTTLPE
jgi:hypothetical protein